MKLGVFTVLLGGQSLEEACKYLKAQGVSAIELAAEAIPEPLTLIPMFYSATKKNSMNLSELSKNMT
jgi:sugar phosphate isomerase/epimerase